MDEDKACDYVQIIEQNCLSKIYYYNVQVNFTDKTEIILSSEQKLVTYTNLKGEKSEYPLATALDNKNAEMAKRLKYTKEILTHMLNGGH